MYIEQIYTKCLSQASYYIESNGEAAIIDPLRDVEQYLEIAQTRGCRIKYIFETHFHADFVSGHLDLAGITGAEIVFGPTAQPSYPAIVAKDKAVFSVGGVQLQVLHTPGHTIESSCFLLYTVKQQPYALFTGDTLFVGDVGRPDLMSGKLSKEILAGLLYTSIHEKIESLPDSLLIFPGHGAGSACGKQMGSELHSTLREEKQRNPVFQLPNKSAFIEYACDGQPIAPAYFFMDASINKEGYEPLSTVLQASFRPLTMKEFVAEWQSGEALLLDTRTGDEFAEGFIPGAINVSLRGDYAFWAGSLLELKKPIYLVCEQGKELESIVRLARIGIHSVKGYLQGGIQTWIKAGYPLENIGLVQPIEMDYFLQRLDAVVLDVRRERERAEAVLKDVLPIPLEELSSRLAELDPDKRYLIYCVGGYRSVIAASLLKAANFSQVFHVPGGMNAIQQQASDLLLNTH